MMSLLDAVGDKSSPLFGSCEEPKSCAACTTEAALRPLLKDIDGMKEIKSEGDLQPFSGRIVAFRKGSPNSWIRQIHNPVSFGLVAKDGSAMVKLYYGEKPERKHWLDTLVKADTLWVRAVTDRELERVLEVLHAGGTWAKEVSYKGRKPLLAKL